MGTRAPRGGGGVAQRRGLRIDELFAGRIGVLVHPWRSRALGVGAYDGLLVGGAAPAALADAEA